VTPPFSEEIMANLDRSAESLLAARLMLEQGYYDYAASRAYYAAFYAATSVVLKEGLDFRKHSGVIAAVHQRFVKSGRLDKDLGKNLNWRFELRSIGDYGETRHVPQEDAAKAIETAESFCRAIRALLDASRFS
jgi:uncharacterized protein (UPF0332 family)